MKTILVTGGSGFLGRRLVSHLSKNYTVVAPTHGELDLTDREKIISEVTKINSQIIIHTAAISNTGLCEQNPELSESINLNGTKYLAEAASKINSKLIFCSSDQIYNGNAEKGPLSEDIDVHPVNVYGKHKLEAERKLQEILPTSVSLRLTWMYDHPSSKIPQHKNLPIMLLEAKEKNVPFVTTVNEYRAITFVGEVVENIEKTFELPGGVYNYGASNTSNSYETYKEIAKIMDVPENLVENDTNRFKAQARNISMNIQKIEKHGIHFSNTVDGFSKMYKSFSNSE